MDHISRHFYQLSEKVLDLVEAQLADLLERSGARCAMLIDRSGYLILRRGKFTSVHPEEMATIGAGTFNALQSFVNMSESPELTVNFHTKSLDNIHFHQVNRHSILLVIFRFHEVAEEDVRRLSKEYAEKIAPELNKDITEVAGWNSVKFISKKLDELFED
jgi:hypothetical protein